MRARLLLGLIFSLASRPLFADDARQKVRVPSFSIDQLEVDGRATAVDAADLDGDGKLDLVAAVLKGRGDETTRSLAIFWNLGGHFERKPDLVVPLDADVCAYDLADVDGKAGEELLAITSSGVRAHAFVGRKVGPTIDLVAQPTLFLRPAVRSLVRFNIAQPLGANRSNALLVPGLSTLAVYQRDAGGAFVKRGVLEVDPKMEINEGGHRERDPAQLGMGHFGISVGFPSIELADLNGDGRLDLVLIQGEKIRGYLQSADGSFPGTPSLKHAFAVRPKAKKDEGEEAEEDTRNFTIDLRVLDVDGDGLADVVVTTTKTSGISSASTTIYLFLGTTKGFVDAPDQVIHQDGSSFAGVQITDLTGDGRPDLLVPSFKLSVMAVIRAITSSSAKVSFLLYPFGANRKFSETPSADRTLTFKFDLEKGDQQAVDMYGDYQGDKRLNLAFGEDEDELSIYGAGEPGKLFTEEPITKVKVRAYGQIASVDLDGRGKSDIVLHYAGTPGHKNEIVVLHNQ